MDEWMLEAYYNAKATVAAFERMLQLERENAELKNQLTEHEDRINQMFRGQQESIGRTLSILVK